MNQFISLLLGILALRWFLSAAEERSHELIPKTLLLCTAIWTSGLAMQSLVESAHPLLGHSLCTPGSAFTHVTFSTASTMQRRILEPAILLWLLSTIYGLYRRGQLGTRSGKAAVIVSFCALLNDGLSTQLAMNPFIAWPSMLHYSTGTIWALALLMLIFAAYAPQRERRIPQIARRTFATLSILFLIISVISAFAPSLLLPSSSVLAAHYYVWFPENWKAGYSIQDPATSGEPTLGEYRSDDSETIRSHLRTMSSLGIDVVILDWWPRKPHLKDRAVRVLEIGQEFPQLSFAVQFETFDLVHNDTSGPIAFTRSASHELELFFEHLAKRLFSSPSYFRIHGAPVVFLYASRQTFGHVPETLTAIRNHVTGKTGHNMYLVGDEIFNHVVYTDAGEPRLKGKDIPDWDRVSQMDALYAYNPYDPTNSYTGGDITIIDQVLGDTRHLYDSYVSIARSIARPIFSTLLVGYNDVILRPQEAHAVIPRTSASGQSTLSRFDAIYEGIGPELEQMKLITSWNEWNEGSQLEDDQTAFEYLQSILEKEHEENDST